MDLDLAYREASRQLLAACCAFALEAVGMCTEDFTQAKVTSIRRNVFMDQRRQEAPSNLEKAA